MEALRLRRMAKQVAGLSKVLDIGYSQCPNPYLSNENVVGLDLHAAHQPENYTSVVAGDANCLETLFPEAAFDAIVMGEFLEHLENPIGLLKQCRTVLKPGGRLVLSTPNPNSPIERLLTIPLSRSFFYTEAHVLLFPQRWLIRVMERAGFCDVKLISGGFPLPVLGLIPFPRPWCYQTVCVGRVGGAS